MADCPCGHVQALAQEDGLLGSRAGQHPLAGEHLTSTRLARQAAATACAGPRDREQRSKAFDVLVVLCRSAPLAMAMAGCRLVVGECTTCGAWPASRWHPAPPVAQVGGPASAPGDLGKRECSPGPGHQGLPTVGRSSPRRRPGCRCGASPVEARPELGGLDASNTAKMRLLVGRRDP